jgi:menaquinone-dependent protoporphyrinogen oxidase
VKAQAAHIARRIAVQARARGLEADLWEAARLSPGLSLDCYFAAVLIASVHLGRHEAEMRRFAALHARELTAMPTAFLSVSLSQAGAENASTPAELRADCSQDGRSRRCPEGL